jgi:hypothetical protein
MIDREEERLCSLRFQGTCREAISVSANEKDIPDVPDEEIETLISSLPLRF